jgi:hypothetical protein
VGPGGMTVLAGGKSTITKLELVDRWRAKVLGAIEGGGAPPDKLDEVLFGVFRSLVRDSTSFEVAGANAVNLAPTPEALERSSRVRNLDRVVNFQQFARLATLQVFGAQYRACGFRGIPMRNQLLRYLFYLPSCGEAPHSVEPGDSNGASALAVVGRVGALRQLLHYPFGVPDSPDTLIVANGGAASAAGRPTTVSAVDMDVGLEASAVELDTSLRACTLEKLVERLTAHGVKERAMRTAILLTYRAYPCPAAELMRLLVLRLLPPAQDQLLVLQTQQAQPVAAAETVAAAAATSTAAPAFIPAAMASEYRKRRMGEQKKAASTLRVWLETYPEDFFARASCETGGAAGADGAAVESDAAGILRSLVGLVADYGEEAWCGLDGAGAP